MAHPTIHIGDKGPAVKEAQDELIARGCNVGPTGADSIFGPKTLLAVRQYQTDRSDPPPHPLALTWPLKVDGVVGFNTWHRLAPDQIKKGDSGRSVYLLQALLVMQGYNPGTEDGLFGPNTEAAVKAFQTAHAHPVDGIVGPITWRALDS
jgi:peptidoglycan hydrolase-like protein with peptidoglycan-binding domain